MQIETIRNLKHLKIKVFKPYKFITKIKTLQFSRLFKRNKGMLREYQDAARKEQRKKLLANFMPAITGMVLSLTLVFVSQYTNLFPPISSWFVSSDVTEQPQYSNRKIRS